MYVLVGALKKRDACMDNLCRCVRSFIHSDSDEDPVKFFMRLESGRPPRIRG